jgi:hypothetical protein
MAAMKTKAVLCAMILAVAFVAGEYSCPAAGANPCLLPEPSCEEQHTTSPKKQLAAHMMCWPSSAQALDCNHVLQQPPTLLLHACLSPPVLQLPLPMRRPTPAQASLWSRQQQLLLVVPGA